MLSSISFEEYRKEEENEQTKELLDNIFNNQKEGITKADKQLQAMLNYYKDVEIEAGNLVKKIFKGFTIYSDDTLHQKCFNFIKNDIKYLCYVDIYNENDNEINIIEVKATTSNKYNKLEYIENERKHKLFIKDNDIYKLDINSNKDYVLKLSRLKNRYTDEGKYIFDLAVQRYIIENSIKTSKKINYYLAVLNANYIYDGYKENNKNVYHKVNGENLISLFELNDLTLDMQKDIATARINLERNLKENNISSCLVGEYCSLGKILNVFLKIFVLKMFQSTILVSII